MKSLSIEKIVNNGSLEHIEVLFVFLLPVVSLESHDKCGPESNEAQKSSGNHIDEVIEDPEVVEAKVETNNRGSSEL